jgi:hypothetical protein
VPLEHIELYVSKEYLVKRFLQILESPFMNAVEEKKTPLSLKIRGDLRRSIENRARAERRSPANLSELILEWGFQQLEAAGDTVTLLRSPGVPKTKRISQETQEQLFTALRIILERAPSAIIEEAARKLAKWAAEYSGEK